MIRQRWISVALAAMMCLCLCSSAMADARLVPDLEGVYLESEPLEMDISVDVQAHMPFDDTRTAQLNAMLGHVSLQVQYQSLGGEIWSRLAVLADGDEVMAVHQRQTGNVEQARFSFLPETTYEWTDGSGISLQTLLGGDESVQLWGLDGSENTWLDDALPLFDALPGLMPDNLKTTSISTTINGMGKAVEKQVVTISSADVEGLGALLAGLVPEGKLRTLLESLQFSGRQTVTLWRNADGRIIRADYAGNAGVSQEDLREVSLIWRLRRDDEQVLDDLTLRTPRVKGSGRNNVVLTRTLKEDGAHLTGEISLQQQVGEDSADKLVLTPELLLTPGSDAAVAAGKIGVACYVGKSLKEQADVTLEVRLNDWMSWELQPNVIKVDAGSIEGIRNRILQGATVELVRRLVLLPAEDTAFLSAGLEPDVWQQIVDAAQSALQ